MANAAAVALDSVAIPDSLNCPITHEAMVELVECASVMEELGDDADDMYIRVRKRSETTTLESTATELLNIQACPVTRRLGDDPLPDAPTQFHTERPRLQEGAFEAMSVTALLQSCEQPFFPWATKRLRSRGQCEVWPGEIVLEKQGGCMGQQELKLAGRSSEMPRKRK